MDFITIESLVSSPIKWINVVTLRVLNKEIERMKREHLLHETTIQKQHSIWSLIILTHH